MGIVSLCVRHYTINRPAVSMAKFINVALAMSNTKNISISACIEYGDCDIIPPVQSNTEDLDAHFRLRQVA